METSEKIIAIVGLTEAIKQYGIPSKFCPTLAILIGGLLGYAEQPDSKGILEGILLGATVTGGYAVTKRAGQSMVTPFSQKDGNLRNPPEGEHDDYRGV